MKYTKSGGQSAVGPEAWFTGTVFIDGVRNPDRQSAVGCAHVRFTPGARTAWHVHPKMPCEGDLPGVSRSSIYDIRA
jgi:quercetin dioxygenase-like cupin family protein